MAPATPRSLKGRIKAKMKRTKTTSPTSPSVSAIAAATLAAARPAPHLVTTPRSPGSTKTRSRPQGCAYACFFFAKTTRTVDGALANEIGVYLVSGRGGDATPTLAAVGTDRGGNGRYFAYHAADPNPFAGKRLKPAEGDATKNDVERWIRDACPGILLSAKSPPRVGVALDDAAIAAATARKRARGGGYGGGDGASHASKKRRSSVSSPSDGAPTFVDAAVPIALRVARVDDRASIRAAATATDAEEVRAFASYAESSDRLPDGRGVKTFRLIADDDDDALGDASAGLLAVRGVERGPKDGHYGYAASRELLGVAIDDAGRPFQTPPRLRNAAAVRAWLDAIVAKSARAPRRLRDAVGAAARAAAISRRGGVILGGGGGFESDFESDGDEDEDEDDEDEDEDNDEDDDETDALQRYLGPATYAWCVGTAYPGMVARLTTMRDRIDAGVAARRATTTTMKSDAPPPPRPLCDRDAMGILSELDARWNVHLNVQTLDDTEIARAVASLAEEENAYADEVRDTAMRFVVKWTEKTERAVRALERRARERETRAPKTNGGAAVVSAMMAMTRRA